MQESLYRLECTPNLANSLWLNHSQLVGFSSEPHASSPCLSALDSVGTRFDAEFIEGDQADSLCVPVLPDCYQVSQRSNLSRRTQGFCSEGQESPLVGLPHLGQSLSLWRLRIEV